MIIDIAATDVVQFDLAISIACMTQSETRFEHKIPAEVRNYAVPDYFYSRDGCLVLSFDGGWYPFLENTRGYNRGPQRWYVPKISEMLARVAVAMQAPKPKGLPGGRVFLHSTGVIRRPASMKEIEIVEWQLPKKSSYLRDRLI